MRSGSASVGMSKRSNRRSGAFWLLIAPSCILREAIVEHFSNTSHAFLASKAARISSHQLRDLARITQLRNAYLGASSCAHSVSAVTQSLSSVVDTSACWRRAFDVSSFRQIHYRYKPFALLFYLLLYANGHLGCSVWFRRNGKAQL